MDTHRTALRLVALSSLLAIPADAMGFTAAELDRAAEPPTLEIRGEIREMAR